MFEQIKEIVLGGTFAFIAGFALWPPRGNYWSFLYDSYEGPTGAILLAVVFLLSILLGAVFGHITDIRLSNFIVGGIVAYGFGMWWIELEIDPISPVHLILYGVLLAGLVGGVAASGHM